ncbi:MAG TPA: hypothetical protein VEL28_11600 [Candidatus Binatia bacterium]|nr:hypothetical protein [Candidatus Binatia bacterium]
MKTFVPTCLALTTFLLTLPTRTDAQPADHGGVVAQQAVAAPGLASWQKLLGEKIAPSRIEALQRAFRLSDGSDLAARFQPDPSSPTPRMVADNLSLDFHLIDGSTFHVDSARILLEPSADGRSLRFEAGGSAFGGAALKTEGTVAWGAGPFGGDKLTGKLSVAGADVAAVRAAFPKRFDPSFTGKMTVDVQGDGVVAEKTTEDAPATPLRGKLSGSIDWSLLGRTSPMQFATDFSLDDRMVRISAGRMSWQNLTLEPVIGTVGVWTNSEFRLSGQFRDVDVAAAAAHWNVPEQWRPQTRITGKIDFYGTPGSSFIAHEARADSMFLPAMAGFGVRTAKSTINGRLAAINGVVTASVRSDKLQIGTIDLGAASFGVTYFRDQLQVNIANTRIWNADAVASASYRPVEHPAAKFGGKIGPIAAAEVAARLAPHLKLDVDGFAEVAFRAGQDMESKKYFAGRAGIRNARWGSDNLFEKLLAALAAADPALASKAATDMLPRHKSGRGTPAERLLFAFAERDGAEYEIGGVLVRSGDLQLEADGRMTKDGMLEMQGHVHLPVPLAKVLVQSAAWLEALQVAEDVGLYVPVRITGTAAAPVVALAPEYLELVAQAKAGKPVEAPRYVPVNALADEQLPSLALDVE